MHIYQWVGNTIIVFKSKTCHYVKERDGIKTNTVRIVNSKEDEEIKQSNIDHILIKDIMTEGFFTRELTDITRFPYKDIIIYIFSWN